MQATRADLFRTRLRQSAVRGRWIVPAAGSPTDDLNRPRWAAAAGLGAAAYRAAGQSHGHALAVLHFTVDRPLLPGRLRAIGHRPYAGRDPLTGPFAPAVQLFGRGGAQKFATTLTALAIARPYTIALLTPDAHHTPALRPEPTAELAGYRRLLAVAACIPFHYHATSPSLRRSGRTDEFDQAVRISADWSALVLRHSAAFLGHRADAGEGDFYDFAALHARTVYLDALLLGTLQRDHIDQLTEANSPECSTARTSLPKSARWKGTSRSSAAHTGAST